MAVQQNKKTRSRRDMRRSHDALSAATLSTEPTTGETHRRHHVSADGYYRGKQMVMDAITDEILLALPSYPRHAHDCAVDDGAAEHED